MTTTYTISVDLPREDHPRKIENIGLIGNINANNDENALRQAKEYVEDSWQGYRVHPTELHALVYRIKTRA